MTFGAKQYEKNTKLAVLIEKADENLYKGKNNGKNQVVI